ncbi:O-antigen ligase family protein [Paenibacillus phytohabitans]|uniref:O-antigen ligase family protein n=1 Tax=Paenibacillus phytohabitans TaxID=2654978 RepID=UPI001FE9E273|nr:O-antigen ligase family protein [Paenibacillus phytohabitans]
MRMKRFQQYGGMAVTLACSLALIAAGGAACVLRGFFFAKEMYLFLTLWFVLCGVLTLGGLVLYAASCWEKRLKLKRELAGKTETVRALPGGVVKGDLAEAERLAGSGRLVTDNAGKIAVTHAADEALSGSSRMSDGRVSKVTRLRAIVWLLPGCCIVICILYAIHAFRGPLSSQGTLDELLRWGFYASFAVFAVLVAGTRRGGTLLAAVWHLLGLVISLSALLAVCGGLPVPYAVAYSQSPEVSATGARLAGLLQYPNAFGAVMAVFLLERLFAAAYGFRLTGPSGTVSGEDCAEGEVGTSRGTVNRAEQEDIVSGEAEGGAVSRAEQENIASGEASRGAVNRAEQENIASGEAEGGAVNRAEQENIASGEAEGGAVSRAGETAIAGRADRARGWSAGLWRTAARLLPLFPYAAALLLSESRGAWLAAASAGAAALLWKRQLSAPLLITGAAPVAAAALLYRQLARTGLAAEPLPGLLLLAGLWAGALLAGLWLHRRSCRAAGWHHAAMLALAAGAWTAAASAVLLQVRARITGPSPTAAARGLFYRDAWKLAAEAPWLGRGGETWRHSYLAAQSRPYVGSQVHSGYLDILLNLGTAGLAAVLLLLLAAGWLIFKASPRLLPPLLVIILHSAVDFDWSYGLIWLLLLLLPAWALAETIARPVAEDTAILTRLRRSWPYAGIAVLCALTFMLSILSYQAMRGAALYKQAARVSGDPAAQTALLRQSLAWNPREPQTAAALSRLLPEEQGMDLLLDSLQFSPGDAALHWELAERYLQGRDPGEALYWVRRSLKADIFNAAKRRAAIEGMLKMAERGWAEGDRRRAADSAAAGLELLRQYSLLAGREYSAGRRHNDRGFGINEQAEGVYLRLRALQALATLDKPEKIVAR